MIDLALSLMTVKKSNSQSCISKTLPLLTSRILSLGQTCEFVSKLKTNFVSLDIVAEAESKLKNLSMKPTQHIAKYLVEFNQHATITGWDSHTLCESKSGGQSGWVI
jgi:hypothetical protein